MRLKAVFLDLDDTLVPTRRLHGRGLEAARRALGRGRPLGRAEFDRLYAAARAAVKRRLGPSPAARGRLLYFKEMVERRGGRQDPALTLAAWRAYESVWDAAPEPGVRRVLAALARRRVVGVITNQVCALQLRKLRALDPRGRLVSVLVTSEEAGADKPDRRPYAEACRRARCRPAEALMVGDHPVHDGAGALRAGLRAAVLRPSGSLPRGAHRLRRLADLPALLASLEAR